MREFSPETIRKYMGRNYVGDHMVIAAAGNIDHDGLVEVAKQRFATSRPMARQPLSALNIRAAKNV